MLECSGVEFDHRPSTMQFKAIKISAAEGSVLGHNIADDNGRRALRKGRILTARDIARLAELGREAVYVAQLEHGDVDENQAAKRLAQGLAGDGLRLSRAQTGRVNVYATTTGLLRLDAARLLELNSLEGITLATLPCHSAVQPGQMVATLKIIPYALPETVLSEAEKRIVATPTTLLFLSELRPKRVGLILSGSPSARQRIVHSFQTALEPRLEKLAASLQRIDFVPLEDEADEARLARKIADHLAAGLQLLILAGETAIMDRHDTAPRALEGAGATIEVFGAPVDPGNLLLLAYHQDVPIVGAPGCARSPKNNFIDLILPRLLAGDRLTRQDIIALGHGGLLEDVPERPCPRSWLT